MAQSQLYNNPAFASGLGDVLQAMLAPKDAPAAAQYDAQRAGMLADTRNYRLGLGQAGESGDYANMMIRALQAGRDYSAEAPEITSAIMSLPGSGFTPQELANIQVGSGVQRASGTFAGRGGSGGGASTGERMSAGSRSLLIKQLAAMGVTDPVLSNQFVTEANNAIDRGMNEDQAREFAISLGQREEIVTDKAGNALQRALARVAPGSVEDWLGGPDATAPGAVIGLTPYSAGQIGQPAAAAPTGIPQGAIDMLMADPAQAANFDAKYGAGAAQAILGG